MRTLILTLGFLTFSTQAAFSQADTQIASVDDKVAAVTAMTEATPGYTSSARFPGGMGKLSSYLKDNLIYPEVASTNNIEGTVKVKFNVQTDGSLANMQILETPHDLLSNAAMEVVQSMPNWRPRYSAGEAVVSEVVLPIEFGLR